MYGPNRKDQLAIRKIVKVADEEKAKLVGAPFSLSVNQVHKDRFGQAFSKTRKVRKDKGIKKSNLSSSTKAALRKLQFRTVRKLMQGILGRRVVLEILCRITRPQTKKTF